MHVIKSINKLQVQAGAFQDMIYSQEAWNNRSDK